MRSLLTDFRRGRDKVSVEVRRARGEISCAECRRLKLKCDKSIPCDTCVRRGCETICPNKTLSTGQGTRFITADTKIQHQKLSEMSKRIRKLEDALQIAHSALNSGHHPLLSEELLEIKNGTARSSFTDSETNDDPPEDLENVLDSYGSLTLSDRGTEEYVAGAIELLVQTSTNSLSDKSGSPNMPSELSHLSRMFPYTPLYLPVNELQVLIKSSLPSFERALVLIDCYLENLSWFFRSVDREQIMEELIPIIYFSNGDVNKDGSTDPHALALILAVFACGAITDPDLEPRNEEAEYYYHLTRASLGLKSVLDGVSLLSIQAISLIGLYDLCSTTRVTPETAWKTVSFSCSLAASIGLHRDPARFNLSPKLVQRRRQVFWELYALDAWKSLGSGRPITFHRSVVDCQFPEDRDSYLNDANDIIPGFWRVKYLYAREIIVDFIERVGSARLLKYSKVLELDKKIRSFNPQGWESRPPSPSSRKTFDIVKCLVLDYMRDTTIVLLHRNFFARAMIDNPRDPLQTSFSPSYRAAYHSASNLIRTVLCHYDTYPELWTRVWPFWEHTFLSSIILGSVAANSYDHDLKVRSYGEFVDILSLMSKITWQPVVGAGLSILLQLYEKARRELYPEQSTPPYTREINPVREASRMASPLETQSLLETLSQGSSTKRPLHVAPEVIFATYTSCSDIVEFASFFSRNRKENDSSIDSTPQCLDGSQLNSLAGPGTNKPKGGPESTLFPETERVSECISYPSSLDVHTSHSFSEDSRSSQPQAAEYLYHHNEPVYENIATNNWHSEPTEGTNTKANHPRETPLRAMSDKYMHSSSYYDYTQYNASEIESSFPGSSHSVNAQWWVSYPRGNGNIGLGTTVGPDFDVSFDIRAALGQDNEDSSPLLLQDLEAWAATMPLPHQQPV